MDLRLKLNLLGNSGSPVLRQPKFDAIGAHVYGGTINSASVIGRYGNPYNDYLAGFGVQLSNDGLNIVLVKAKTNTNLESSPFGFSNGQVSPALGANRRNAVSGQQPSYEPTGYRKAAPPVTPRTLAAPICALIGRPAATAPSPVKKAS